MTCYDLHIAGGKFCRESVIAQLIGHKNDLAVIDEQQRSLECLILREIFHSLHNLLRPCTILSACTTSILFSSYQTFNSSPTSCNCPVSQLSGDWYHWSKDWKQFILENLLVSACFNISGSRMFKHEEKVNKPKSKARPTDNTSFHI